MIKIYNSDCLKILPKFPDKCFDAVITDPPFGTTACKWDTIICFECMWKELKRVTKDNGAIVLFGSEPFSSKLRMSNLKMYKYDWVWDKVLSSGFQNCKNIPLKQHENIMVFYIKKPNYSPQMVIREKSRKSNQPKTISESNRMTSKKLTGKTWVLTHRYPTSIISFSNANRSKNNHFHPTQKPVDLLEYLIKTYTNPGETILDFTMGSGSTLVAAKKTGRNCIGIEQEKKYCKIAVERLKAV